MTQEQLQDALGMIDDDMIDQVDHLRQARDQDLISSPVTSFRKKILRRELLKWSSLAAGICLLISVGFLWRVSGSTAEDSAFSEGKYYSEQENAQEALEDNLIVPGTQNNPTSPETGVVTENSNQQEETVPAVSGSTPPTLILFHGSDSFAANRGAYFWSYPGDDGATWFITAEAYHPLDSKHLLTLVETSEPFLQLQFASSPSDPLELHVQCWEDSHWGDITADAQALPIEDGQLLLQEGAHIYQVTAKWERGTVYYSFYVCYTPQGQ